MVAVREQQLKDLLELVKDTHFQLLRYLNAHFGYLYSDWEMVVYTTHALSTPPQGKRDHNMPFNIKLRIESINEDFATAKPHLAVELFEDAIKHLVADNADLFLLQVNDLEKQMANNFDLSLMQRLHMLKDLKSFEARLYELPVLAMKEKIGRYQQLAQNIMTMGGEMKTMEAISALEAEEREKLIIEMMEIAKQKDDFSGNSSRNPQDAAKYRKDMEARLNGAQPWRQMRDQNDKFVSNFLQWARKNGRKDCPEAMKEFIDLQQAGLNGSGSMASGSMTIGGMGSMGIGGMGIGGMGSGGMGSAGMGIGGTGSGGMGSGGMSGGMTGGMNQFSQQGQNAYNGGSAAMQESMDQSLKRGREDGYNGTEGMEGSMELEPRKRARIGEE